MTPPVLLTSPSTLTLTLNAVVDTADSHHPKRSVALPPLGVLIPPTLAPTLSPSSSSTPTSLSPSSYHHRHDDDDDNTDASAAHPARVRQWTGIPIRAIAPLPRRMRAVTAPSMHQLQDAAPRGLRVVGPSPGCSSSSSTASGSLAAARAQWLGVDPDSDDDGHHAEDDGEDDDDDYDEEVGTVRVRVQDRKHAPAVSRYCAYESITAAEGLSAWSFEELRVECYAQSLIARGTRPPPVDQPYLAIPPAFVPRIIHRN